MNWTVEKVKRVATPPPLPHFYITPPPFHVYPPFLAKHFVSRQVTQFSEGPNPKENFNMLNLKNLPLPKLPDWPGKARHYLQRGIRIILERPFAGPKLPETVMQSLFKTPLVYCPSKYPNREFCKKVLTVTIFPTRCLISKTQESCSEFRCTRSAMN